MAGWIESITGKAFDWNGCTWTVVGEPDMQEAREKFIQIRPLNCFHPGRDKLMPIRIFKEVAPHLAT